MWTAWDPSKCLWMCLLKSDVCDPVHALLINLLEWQHRQNVYGENVPSNPCQTYNLKDMHLQYTLLLCILLDQDLVLLQSGEEFLSLLKFEICFERTVSYEGFHCQTQKVCLNLPAATFILNQRAPAPKFKVYTSIWVYWHWSTHQAWLYSKLLWKQSFRTLSELSVRLGGSPKSNVCVLLHVLNFLFFCEAYKKHSMQTRITGSSCLMYLWFEMTDHLYYS